MADAAGDKGKAKGGGIVVPLIILTLLAGGAGFGFGSFILAESMKGKPKAAADKGATEKKSVPKKKAGHGGKKSKYAKKKSGHADEAEHAPTEKKVLRLVAIPAIITNLKEPEGSWIRIESKAVASAGSIDNEAALTQRLSQDILMYLRTLRVGDIDSSNGLLQVRTDLNDIARIRSKGKLDEIVIQGLIVE